MKKLSLVLILSFIGILCFANSITINNTRARIEDELVFTNKTKHDVHIDIFLKDTAKSPEEYIVSAIVPARVRGYEIDTSQDHRYRGYEQIVIKSSGEILDYNHKIRHDNLEFTISDYIPMRRFPVYANSVEFNNSGYEADDFVVVDNDSKKDFVYSLYALSKKDEVFLCSGTVMSGQSADIFTISSYSQEYKDIKTFKLYYEPSVKVSSKIRSDDLVLTVY